MSLYGSKKPVIRSQSVSTSPTDISGRSAGGGHHAVCALDLGQAKVADHDFGVVLHAVVEKVLRLRPGWTEKVKSPTHTNKHEVNAVFL